MKGLCLCFGISLLAWAGYSQSDTLTLPGFSRMRSEYFEKQKKLVKTYAVANNKLISFTDEKGNHVKLMGITPSGQPVYFTTLNADAAITSATIQLRIGGNLGLNIQGEGMVVGVWDGGTVKDHVELGQRVIAKEGAIYDTHATHVTGTLVATGVNPAAKGMAPLAQATTHDFDNDEAEMAALAKPDQSSLLFSNHSYGTATGWLKNNGVWQWTGDSHINAIEDYRFGFYGSRAQTIDQIAWLAPYYTIVWAAGNDRGDVGDGSKPVDCNGGSGYDCVIPEAVSKNIISVGAVNKVPTYSNPFDVPMSFFSSWGPTDDGRIKPDLVGAGVNLFSLSATGTDTYTTLSGTSMAAPNVTGSLLLLQELYSQLHGGDFMRAATLKALAIHTAKEAGNFPGPDYSFGWGLLDAGAAGRILTNQDDRNIVVKELKLENGIPVSLRLDPKANQKITATIAWTDPPGDTLAPSLDPLNLNLVNDLDIRIIDDQGREQLPWVLDPSNPSQKAAFGDNFRDNIEKIEFNNPEGKSYSLVVNHKGTLKNGHQNFSLILSYQSSAPSKFYYWVGDSGNWPDGSHWSFSSGGSPAFQVPGSGDRVIVDENSFDAAGSNLIGLTADARCSALLWLNSKTSGLALNGYRLSIGKQCTIASAGFSIATPGTFHFQSSEGTGTFFSGKVNLAGAVLLFDGGTWDLKGRIAADELRLSSGELNISGSSVSVEQLTATVGLAGKLHLDRSQISLSGASNMDGTTLVITSDHSSLAIDSGMVTLQWQSLNFPGEIRIGSRAEVIMNGDNRVGKVLSFGQIGFTGNNQVDTLVLQAGARLDLSQSTVQSLSAQTQLNGSAGQSVIIASPAASSLSFSDHSRLCFDYLQVTNVAATGNAVVNAGTHSTLSNAANWQEKECAHVLFADFVYQDNCSGSSAEFTDRSLGDITGYSWTFDSDPLEVHEKDPIWKFDHEGTYPVTLTTNDHASSNSITRMVGIMSNTLAENKIVSNGSSLTSLIVGNSYQWFKDGLAQPGATDRSYLLTGNEGAYYVLVFDEWCNISSDTITVAGLEDLSGIEIYPNPASASLWIKLPATSQGTISLSDMVGRKYLQQVAASGDTELSTIAMPAGIYVLQVEQDGVKTRKKIIVRH